MFRATLGLPIEARLGIGALLLVPLGLALGIPFPAGLARLVHGRAPDALGWAWAANGCASVVGPVLAALLALDAGFGAVMALAAGCYAAAGLVFERARAQSASDASP